ncbi:alternative ribosome rescue aminoacyl-tRNA hydrolase ArfB [Paraflavitalea sp. CAU 1676]|uniref:alternative ribosome rescue aminoacyl-tRNA hydrolase ArfB n=1 Tax=Paraflavitalea sp. CAU 1676 TaxID=3032598 RepID=UPI0031F3B177
MDITKEIEFQTARSGGKGGQNVNKVETMVEGYFHIDKSLILSNQQKEILSRKLASRVNSEGFLQVKSQVHRSQLENKQEVVEKMHLLIEQALKKEKKRIATKPSKAAKAKRLDSKKKQSGHKQNRQKIRPADH